MISNITGDVPLGGNLDNYGYDPSLAMIVIFLSIFAVSSTTHLWQSFLKNSPRFMVIMAIGGYLEVLGWAGRLWSHVDQFGSGYMMQIICIVIAPTFMSAALYVLLGLVISLVNQEKSYFSQKTFKIVFITVDVFSLVLQAAGGGLAATSKTPAEGRTGSHIMLAGIVIQLIVMIAFVGYAWWWSHRSNYSLRTGDRDLVIQLAALALCSIAIILRGCYRTGELSQGFSGVIAETQSLFLLDAIPISSAMISLNVFHPSRLLKGAHIALAQNDGSCTSLDAEKAVGLTSIRPSVGHQSRLGLARGVDSVRR